MDWWTTSLHTGYKVSQVIVPASTNHPENVQVTNLSGIEAISTSLSSWDLSSLVCSAACLTSGGSRFGACISTDKLVSSSCSSNRLISGGPINSRRMFSGNTRSAEKRCCEWGH
jgi:hypothetical protein